jgi:hypothetical protein
LQRRPLAGQGGGRSASRSAGRPNDDDDQRQRSGAKRGQTAPGAGALFLLRSASIRKVCEKNDQLFK